MGSGGATRTMRPGSGSKLTDSAKASWTGPRVRISTSCATSTSAFWATTPGAKVSAAAAVNADKVPMILKCLGFMMNSSL